MKRNAIQLAVALCATHCIASELTFTGEVSGQPATIRLQFDPLPYGAHVLSAYGQTDDGSVVWYRPTRDVIRVLQCGNSGGVNCGMPRAIELSTYVVPSDGVDGTLCSIGVDPVWIGFGFQRGRYIERYLGWGTELEGVAALFGEYSGMVLTSDGVYREETGPLPDAPVADCVMAKLVPEPVALVLLMVGVFFLALGRQR